MKEPFLLPLSLHRHPAVGLVHIKGIPFCLKICIQGVCHPAPKSQIKECVIQPQESDQRHAIFMLQDLNLKCALHFWIVVDFRYSQLDNQEQPRISSVHNVILDTIEKCER